MIFQPCSSSLCQFDKAATTPIIFFEIAVLVLAIFFIFYLSRYTKKILLKFFIIAIGIFIFEFITHPLWYNFKMGEWAYVYRDVSWLLTIGWATIILTTTVVIDHLLPKVRAYKRFFLYLLATLIIGLIGETVVMQLGIRSYSPETHQLIGNLYIPLLGIPWGSLYYIPVFMALVIGFYKYWSLVIDNKILLPIKKIKWGRYLAVSVVGVLLFEVMIDAMISNAGLPAWSYIFRDINIILTISWIIIIWLAILFVDKVFIHFDLFKKFISYILLATAIALPIEAIFVAKNIRIYSPSTTENFSGYLVPFSSVPVEVIFVFPFYLAK
jgi:hypothetical protein